MRSSKQISNICQNLLQSGLITESLLERYSHRCSDEESILELLLQDGFLTSLQIEYFRQGKAQELFLNGKYKLMEELGAGGMGRVYLCEHLILQKLVAIKILQKGIKKGDSDTESTLARFYREARAVALLDHPNIVKLYDVDRIDEKPFMVLEYVDGINLHLLVSRSGPLRSQQVANYLRQAAAGLEHAHQKGLIHRDIKPGNLLVTRQGVVKLLDLGLARFSRDESQNKGITELFDANHIIGTIDFMAPEQAAPPQTIDIRSDIYSLGCTCYYLASGKLPFTGSIAQTLYGHKSLAPEPLSMRVQHFPSILLETIERMMEKSPADRFQSPQEIIDALGEYGNQVFPPPEELLPARSPEHYRLGLSKDFEVGSISTPKPTPHSDTVSIRTNKEQSIPSRENNTRHQTEKKKFLLRIFSVAFVAIACLLAIGIIFFVQQQQSKENRNTEIPSGSKNPSPKIPPQDVPFTGKIVRGGGSTFVNTPMSHWAKVYESTFGVRIDYRAIGSGKGIQGLKDQVFMFSCTDVCLTDKQLTEIRQSGQEVVHIPLVMGAVVVTQNLPELQIPLRYTGPVLADIYLGKITRWNADALKILNPGVDLPDTPITVVHRADSSGTSYIWTDYLSKASAQWESHVGRGTLVKWPMGEAVTGNNGVANLVSRKAGSIGYVELTYALQNNLNIGLIKNQEGQFVSPTLESVTVAAENSLNSIPEDLRYTLTDATGENSYPLAGTVWAILNVNQSKNPQAEHLVHFLNWAIHDGQAYLKDLHFAPLPIELVKRSQDKLRLIQLPAKKN